MIRDIVTGMIVFAFGFYVLAYMAIGLVILTMTTWTRWRQRRAYDAYIDLVLARGFSSELQGAYCIDAARRGNYEAAVHVMENDIFRETY